MKKVIGVVIIFMALILVVNIFAYESTITVKTGKPNTAITLKIGDQITGKTLPGGTLTETSDSVGEVVFNYNLEPILVRMGFQALNSAGTTLTFLNGKQAIFFPINKTENPYVILDKIVEIDLNRQDPTIEIYSGEEVEDVVKEEIIEESNETAIIEEIVEEVSVEETEVADNQESPITGKAIGSVKDVITSAKTYYILGGLIILLFIIIFARKKMSKKGSFNVTKLSDMQKNKEKIENTDDKLADAERKIKEAKEELDEIKGKKSKLKEAQDKLEKDKEELKKLEDE